MGNPMLQQLQQNQSPRPINNPMQMVQQFQQFINGGITPERAHEILNQKVQSGELSQQQLDNLMQQARGMLSLFRR